MDTPPLIRGLATHIATIPVTVHHTVRFDGLLQYSLGTGTFHRDYFLLDRQEGDRSSSIVSINHPLTHLDCHAVTIDWLEAILKELEAAKRVCEVDEVTRNREKVARDCSIHAIEEALHARRTPPAMATTPAPESVVDDATSSTIPPGQHEASGTANLSNNVVDAASSQYAAADDRHPPPYFSFQSNTFQAAGPGLRNIEFDRFGLGMPVAFDSYPDIWTLPDPNDDSDLASDPDTSSTHSEPGNEENASGASDDEDAQAIFEHLMQAHLSP